MEIHNQRNKPQGEAMAGPSCDYAGGSNLTGRQGVGAADWKIPIALPSSIHVSAPPWWTAIPRWPNLSEDSRGRSLDWSSYSTAAREDMGSISSLLCPVPQFLIRYSFADPSFSIYLFYYYFIFLTFYFIVLYYKFYFLPFLLFERLNDHIFIQHKVLSSGQLFMNSCSF